MFLKRLLNLSWSAVIVCSFALPVFGQEIQTADSSDQKTLSYTQLKKNSRNLLISWDEQNALPSTIEMRGLKMDWQSDNYESRSYEFLDDYHDLFGLKKPAFEELHLTRTTSDKFGMTHITLQQYVNALPVYGTQVKLHFQNDGSLSSINGSYDPEASVISTNPKISQSSAVQIVSRNLQDKLQLQDKEFLKLGFKAISSDLLIIKSKFFNETTPRKATLAWRIFGSSEYGVNDWIYYVDAVNGKIIWKEEAVLHAENRETYVLADCNDSSGTLTYDETGLRGTYDADAGWTHLYADYAYDYFADPSKFGMDSYDGGGGVIRSYTHYETSELSLCFDVVDAFWRYSTSSMHFARGVYGQDIIGHEFAHGAIDQLVGLDLSGQSLILHESYADILGMLIESYSGETDWIIGEDLVANRSDGCTQGFRNLADPSSYTGTCDGTGSAEPNDVADLAGDYSDEHAASNIPSYAFYLLSEGGTHTDNGAIVLGIGLANAEQIYIHMLENGYLDTNANLEDSYNATMQSCLDLNASDSTTYPISYCESVFDAFAAVGINTDSSYAWANITASATSGTAPLAITFDGTGSVGINSTISSYAWDFGDSSTATRGAVSHTFSNPGTYAVTLTVIDSAGYTSDTTTTITVYPSNTISSDTTWSAARSPYVISGTVSVASGYTLTIDPGVVVKFLDTSSSLTVNGTLIAEGTSTDSIAFTSYKDDTFGGDTNGDGAATIAAAGDWKQIKIAGSATATFDYVTMQYGGSSDAWYPRASNPMLLIDDNATSVSVNHSTLQYSSYNTIEVDPNSTSVIANSTISNTASQYAVYAASDSSTFTDNTISSPGTVAMIIYIASPTLTDNTFTASAYGLNVVGASTPIISNNTFTGNTYPIWFSAVTSGTSLSGNTGSGNTYNLIVLSGSTAGDFRLDTSNDLLYGINGLTVSAGDTLTIDPGVVVKFLNSSSYLTVNGTIDAEGTVADPIAFTSYKDDTNGGDTNGDGSATTAAAGDWSYVKIVSSATATFDYATMQYGGSSDAWYPHNMNPMLLIDDNAANVSINHSTLQYSNYYTIEIDPGSTTIITNSTISNTASQYAVYAASDNATFTDNTISASSSFGMYVTSASPIVTSNTFAGSSYGLYVTGSTSAPSITGNTFTGNMYPIYLSTLTSGTTLTGNTGSGNTNNIIFLSGSTNGDYTLNGTDNTLPYVIYYLTVSSPDTLVVTPGTVLKFLHAGGILTINGTLDAEGTVTEPVVFTSYKDDTYGGDTNGDGTATTPAAGDWAQIKIAGSATATFDYVAVQYGGYSSNPMLLIDDSATSVSVNHSTLENSKYYTLEIDPDSTSVIANSTLSNAAGQYTIYDTGSDATFTGNAISSTGSCGMITYNSSPTITDNTFTNSLAGLYAYGPSAAPNVTSNTFTNNYYGIQTANMAAPIITNNLITSNSVYGLYSSSSTATLTAESNWWGSSTGPYNATSNPTGTGNAVSNYVDFTPWLTADPTIDATPPTEATLTFIRKDPWTKSVALAWTNPTDTDFDHVRITRTDSSGTTTLSDAVTATSYADTTVSYGTSYTYTLYTLDTTGNVSTGITTAAQVVRNPFPTNLILTPGNTTIAATWNASSAPAASIGTYKIYYGTAPTAMTNVIDVGNVTSTTISGLTNGTEYFVSVIVFSKGGVASPRSVIKAARPHP